MKRITILGAVLGVALGFWLTWHPSSEASRNSGGVYTLPAGNPVTTGTTITSTWANSTLNDVGTEIQNSLDRYGRGGMINPLRLANGTASLPALAFTSETASGFYRAGSHDLRMAVNSVQAQSWSNTAVSFQLPTSTQEGLTCTQALTDTAAITATGNGSGAGVTSTGGNTSGVGISGTGGASNGTGVVGVGTGAGGGVSGTGGTTSGNGMTGTGGTPNGTGVLGLGLGSGVGVLGIGGDAGTAAGVFGRGSGDAGIGVVAQAAVDSTGAAQTIAAELLNGNLKLAGALPNYDVGFSNTLTPTNIVKAWFRVSITSGSPSSIGFNDALTESCASKVVTVNLATAVSGTTNTVCSVTAGGPMFLQASAATSSFAITAWNTAGTQVDLCAGGTTGIVFSCIVMGVQ